ncbi:hypothetical protein LCGC14_2117540, partial [marine sediment metagenome]
NANRPSESSKNQDGKENSIKKTWAGCEIKLVEQSRKV